METNVPIIQSCTWYVAKDAAFANEYEDAFYLSAESARFAIADGVSSAIFSAKWAQCLTKHLVESRPDLDSPGNWVSALSVPRDLWLKSIDLPRMPIHQKAKLRQVGGAFCTICLVEFESLPDTAQGPPRYLLRSYASGDSCLLHIRSKEVLTTFPLKMAAEFERDPISLCSVASSRDNQFQPSKIELECLEGDLIILVTDAIAKWMFEAVERGDKAPWEQLWRLDQEQWTATIEELRTSHAMKRDDTTMIVLQVGSGEPAWLRDPNAVDQVPEPIVPAVESPETELATDTGSVISINDLPIEQLEDAQQSTIEMPPEQVSAVSPATEELPAADASTDPNANQQVDAIAEDLRTQN